MSVKKYNLNGETDRYYEILLCPNGKYHDLLILKTFTNNYLEKSINTTHHLLCQMEKEHSKQREFQDVLPEHNESYISYHRF